ncbi:MAG: hypothetical protein ACNA8R_05845 [Nitriliruptoraceae bacterium]
MTVGRPLTAAQRRLRDEVLGWGGDRPRIPAGLAGELADAVAGAVAAGCSGSAPVASARRAVSAVMLARPPGTAPLSGHDARTVRGLLLTEVVAEDLAGGHRGELATVLDRAVVQLASARPGDPASASAWWNAAAPGGRAAIRAEVEAIAAQLRAIWPPLDPDQVRVSVRPRLRAPIPGQRVDLTARPLVVVDSRRRDERARAVVLVARTGMPRPQEDRLVARVTALVATLAAGRPPFRWGVLHVTDGRVEVEDLDADLLLATAATAGSRVGTVLDGAPIGGRGDRGARRR